MYKRNAKTGRHTRTILELALLTYKKQCPTPVPAFAERRQSPSDPSSLTYVPLGFLSPRAPLDQHLEQVVCHCNDCKKTSGSTLSTNAVTPSKDLTITGPVKEYVSKADSGNDGGLSAKVEGCLSSYLDSSQSPVFSVANVDVPSRTSLPAWETMLLSRVDTSHTLLRSRLTRKVSRANVFLADLVSQDRKSVV